MRSMVAPRVVSSVRTARSEATGAFAAMRVAPGLVRSGSFSKISAVASRTSRALGAIAVKRISSLPASSRNCTPCFTSPITIGVKASWRGIVTIEDRASTDLILRIRSSSKMRSGASSGEHVLFGVVQADALRDHADGVLVGALDGVVDREPQTGQRQDQVRARVERVDALGGPTRRRVVAPVLSDGGEVGKPARRS